MHFLRYCFVIASTLLLMNCTKTKTVTQTKTVTDTIAATTYPDYMMLKPGNYWVYQTYRIDSGVASSYGTAGLDSFYVEKDTLINGNTYHKLVKIIAAFVAQTQISFLRDSLSYVVTSGGSIIFSSQDFTSVFSTINYTNPLAGVTDTVPVTTQMGFKDSLITVPIGVFPTNTLRQIYHLTPPLVQNEYDYRYAENIGLICETVAMYAYPGEPFFEDRLLRYHVE